MLDSPNMFVTRTGFRSAQKKGRQKYWTCVFSVWQFGTHALANQLGSGKTIRIFSEEAPNCWGFQVVQPQGHFSVKSLVLSSSGSVIFLLQWFQVPVVTCDLFLSHLFFLVNLSSDVLDVETCARCWALRLLWWRRSKTRFTSVDPEAFRSDHSRGSSCDGRIAQRSKGMVPMGSWEWIWGPIMDGCTVTRFWCFGKRPINFESDMC